MKSWDTTWERLSQGGHAVMVGCRAIPSPTLSVRLVEVDCAASSGEGGCLEDARRRISGGFGAAANYWESALGQVRRSVRRHLLNEAGPPEDFERYLEAFSLARGTKPPTVLVFRSVDRADASSLQLLRRLLTSPFGLPIATLFCFESTRPESPEATSLLNLLRETLPTAAVVTLPKTSGHPTQESQSVAGTQRVSSDQSATQSDVLARFESLSTDLKTVLRAAATMGNPFESEALSTLLRLDEAEVLLRLQQAADSGIEFEDHGQGRFRWKDAWVTVLRENTLPSLRETWSHRLAEFFGGLPTPEPNPEPVPDLASVPRPQPPSTKSERRDSSGSSRQDELLEGSPEPGPRVDDIDWHAALSDLAASEPPTPAPTFTGAPHERAVPPSDQFQRRASQPLRSPQAKDRARAASYSEQAGKLSNAARAYVDAAREASDSGAYRRASELVARARQILAQLPDNEDHRGLDALALLTLANTRWQAAGGSQDNSLESALEALAASRPLLNQASDPDLLVQYAGLAAGICYDIGTPEALEGALRELSTTGKQLLDARHPLHAARLLNDEAALWVRLGDPVRAHHLLTRARAVFGKLITSHPEAPRELAETEHLTARLMLHARARPGREQEAIELGIEHALSAEDGYRSLHDERTLARVWETLARLETRLGRFDSARAHLDQARAAQLRRGDGVGLARSSAAYAELFAQAGAPERALDELEQSATSNEQNGSIAGLAFNLESLEQLLPVLPGATRARAQALQTQLRRVLGGSGWESHQVS